jgi:hypothetical protein
MLPNKFRSIWPSCVRVEDFQKLTNQKKELSVVDLVKSIYGRSSIEIAHFVLIQWLP